MEIRRTVTSFTYKIEPKPEGGFIARSSDPAVPSLEAPTREELQRQIQAKLASVVSSELGGLKLPFGLGKEISLQVKPRASFSFHSDGAETPNENATPEQIQHATEEVADIVAKKFPELSAAIAQKAAQNNPQSVDNAGQTVNVKITSQRFGGNPFRAEQKPGKTGLLDGADGNSPIRAETSSFGRFLWILLAVLIAAGAAYMLVYRR